MVIYIYIYTSLIRLLLSITEGCGIRNEHMKGIICTNRPDSPDMRRQKNVMSNVGIIVSNDFVMAHTCKVIKTTLIWKQQLYDSVL
jgi:hypothetical protein